MSNFEGGIIARTAGTVRAKSVVYVITTTYEEFKLIQEEFIDADFSFLYVYNPLALLTVNPPPVDVVNLFDLSKVALPEERLWVDGSTYVNASGFIDDVLQELVKRFGTMIHSSVSAFMTHVNDVFDSFNGTLPVNPT